MSILSGTGTDTPFNMDKGLEIIKRAVRTTLQPYIIDVFVKISENSSHITVIVVYLSDSNKVSYSWLDSNSRLLLAGVENIKAAFRKAGIDSSGNLTPSTNCTHFHNDDLPPEHPVSICRRAATPENGMCLSLTALFVFHVYVRQYSIQQIKKMWTVTRPEDIRTQAMALVTACLLQIEIDAYGALYTHHAKIMDDEERRKEPASLDKIQDRALRALEILNTVNFTNNSLHEPKTARILPQRIAPQM